MKNLAILFLCLLFMGSHSTIFAQCDISGADAFKENEEEEYSTEHSEDASYFWSVTGVLNIVGDNTESSIDVDASGPGSGEVCVTRFEAGKQPCCSCKEVTVEELPPPPCIPATGISVQQIEVPGQGCPGDIIDFIATIQPTDATPGSFYWEAGTDFIISNPFFQQTGGSSISIPTPAGEGSVWIRVTFTSCDGTQVTALTLVLWEFNCFKKVSPFLFKGTGTVVPNPFSDQTQLHFDVEQTTDAQVVVYNVAGKLIYSKDVDFHKGKNVIALDNLPTDEKGMLFYQVVTEEGVLANGKMLREE